MSGSGSFKVIDVSEDHPWWKTGTIRGGKQEDWGSTMSTTDCSCPPPPTDCSCPQPSCSSETTAGAGSSAGATRTWRRNNFWYARSTTPGYRLFSNTGSRSPYLQYSPPSLGRILQVGGYCDSLRAVRSTPPPPKPGEGAQWNCARLGGPVLALALNPDHPYLPSWLQVPVPQKH